MATKEIRQFEPNIRDIVTEGDVVQIGMGVDGFMGCFMVVTEIRKGSPYAIGYVSQPGRPDVPLFTRIKWTDLAFVGKASLVHVEHLQGRLKEIALAEAKGAEEQVPASTGQKLRRKSASGK